MTMTATTVTHILPAKLLKAAAMVAMSVKGEVSSSYRRYTLDHVQIRRSSGSRTDIIGCDGIMLIHLVHTLVDSAVEDPCDHTVMIPAKVLLEAVKRAAKVRPRVDGQDIRIDVTGNLAVLRPLKDVTQPPVETPVAYEGFPETDHVEAERKGTAIMLDAARLAVLAETLNAVRETEAVSETALHPVTLWIPPTRDRGFRVEASGTDGVEARATIMPLNTKTPT